MRRWEFEVNLRTLHGEKYESFYKKTFIGKYSYLKDRSIEVKKGKENKKSVFFNFGQNVLFNSSYLKMVLFI